MISVEMQKLQIICVQQQSSWQSRQQIVLEIKMSQLIQIFERFFVKTCQFVFLKNL